jgi:7-cyano-7-deazaguanine synthase
VVLLADEARTGPVTPVYVGVGLAWEPAERRALDRLLAVPPFAGRVEPLATLSLDMRDLYPATHWAIRGAPPAFDTPDEDVYLVGRNLILLAKAAVLCCQRGIPRIALGPLAGNPFPDARPGFFEAMRHALSLGLDHPIAVDAPFLDWSKADVIRRGHALGVPFGLTLSCMSPLGPVTPAGPPRHCGRCSKCRERRDAFDAAGQPDPVVYAAACPR